MALNLEVKLALQGINLKDYAEGIHLRIARGARNAAEIMAARAKVRLRSDVIAGGLGEKVANAWRADIYPVSPAQHTHTPAVLIHSNAPLIVNAFAASTEIVPNHGVYLAIPTENVPRRGRAGGLRGQASRLSVKEVEAMYNQKLTLLAGGGMSGASGGGHFKTMLGCVDKTLNRRRRLDLNRKRGPRGVFAHTEPEKLTVMFIFVRQVHLSKRLDWPEIFKSLQDDWATLFPEEVAKAVNAGSN